MAVHHGVTPRRDALVDRVGDPVKVLLGVPSAAFYRGDTLFSALALNRGSGISGFEYRF